MTATKFWVALAAFFMALVVSPIWAYAETKYDPLFARWFCHDADTVVELLDKPDGQFPIALNTKIAFGFCAGALFSINYVFHPLETGVEKTAPDGFRYLLVKGQVLVANPSGPLTVYAPTELGKVKLRNRPQNETQNPAVRDVPGHRGWLISDETL